MKTKLKLEMSLKGCVFWNITVCPPSRANQLHGLISKNTELFIDIAVRIRNPTWK